MFLQNNISRLNRLQQILLSKGNCREGLLPILLKERFDVDFFLRNQNLPVTGFPYGRKVLISNFGLEVMLATWEKEKCCAPHNHGKSAGIVIFLKGMFKETLYGWRRSELVAVDETIHHEMSESKIEENIIHSCVALSEGAMSLHIYFPRIEAMEVHDMELKRTLIVADDCGAWIPDAFYKIKKEIPWKKVIL